MGTRYKDYPIYTYDEPAVYTDFHGGLNTDPSNEHLQDSELRDVTNMTFLSGALVKRKGAHKLCDISCEDSLTFVQGMFLFTYRVTYLIIAADGKLYQGIFNEDSTIEMSRIHILKYEDESMFAYDETNPFEGLPKKLKSDVKVIKHDGFIQTFFTNMTTGEKFERNDRGDYNDIIGGAIEVGDVFQDESGIIARDMLCIKPFEKAAEYPSDSAYWVPMKKPNSIISMTRYGIQVDNEILYIDSNSNADDWAIANQYHVYDWEAKPNKVWEENDIALFKGYFYRCVHQHNEALITLADPEYFYNVSDVNQTAFRQETDLVFQNHSRIEAAAYDNRLFVATGTRIIEVYLDTDELRARPLPPYLCNYTEIANIGYNYLSPYPELAVAGKDDAVSTEMDAVKVRKLSTGGYLLTPVMHIAAGDSIENYRFRWEKYIDGTWVTIIPYRSQDQWVTTESGSISINQTSRFQLEVSDANSYRYRCSFCNEFKTTTESAKEWSKDEQYKVGDIVFVGSKLYKCLARHSSQTIKYPNDEFGEEAFLQHDVDGVPQWDQETTTVWTQVFDLEVVPFMYKTVDPITLREVWVRTTIYDYIPNIAIISGNRSATSVPFDDSIGVDNRFLTIHSCKSVIVDGNKLLFYNDSYNSGEWYKTAIGNPYYISMRGSLSFKTSKNEAIVSVVPFQGNLIVFANSDEAGGSIHLVQGNGDDYDDKSGYYSPYRRSTINASVSCDNGKTIQVCDNYLVFKYYRTVYCINASDLSNEVVRVTQCNDAIMSRNPEIEIPWDEDCVSEVTDSYYALLWPKRYEANEYGELVLAHPAMRMKMYYKISSQRKDGSYTFPWLKDEGDSFEARHIAYFKGTPIHLYSNMIITYDKEDYQDIGKDFPCTIKTKGYGLEYPSQFKMVERVMVSFHRDQFNPVSVDLTVKNEAGHSIIEPDDGRLSIGDLGVVHVGSKNDGTSLRLTSTIRDDKMFIPINMFPCLLAEAKIVVKTSGTFAFVGITYHYTSCDNPDTTPYDTYTNIIRPKEVK